MKIVFIFSSNVVTNLAITFRYVVHLEFVYDVAGGRGFF